MKYSAEQLKNLINLSQHGCSGKVCSECVWWARSMVGARCRLPRRRGIGSEKQAAKVLIQEIIG